MTTKSIAVVLGAALLLPALAFAEVQAVNAQQPASVTEAAKKTVEGAEMPTVYHAGGRHDQRLHEATIRARANGQKMERPSMHAGGRHDTQAHEAAIKADEKRIADETRP